MYNFVYCIYSFYNALIRVLVDKVSARFPNLDLGVTMSYPMAIPEGYFPRKVLQKNNLFILKTRLLRNDCNTQLFFDTLKDYF